MLTVAGPSFWCSLMNLVRWSLLVTKYEERLRLNPESLLRLQGRAIIKHQNKRINSTLHPGVSSLNMNCDDWLPDSVHCVPHGPCLDRTLGSKSILCGYKYKMWPHLSSYQPLMMEKETSSSHSSDCPRRLHITQSSWKLQIVIHVYYKTKNTSD